MERSGRQPAQDVGSRPECGPRAEREPQEHGGESDGRQRQEGDPVGVTLRATKIDLHGVRQQIGEAGRQFGKLAGEVRNVAEEVRAAREKAEQIAKILS